MNSVVGILGTVALVICGQLMLKAGMKRVGAVGAARLRKPASLLRDIVRSPLVPLGFVVYGFSALAWIVILSRVELSFAYPFLGLAYAAVVAAAVVVFGERLAPRQWLGVALVVAGVVAVAASA